MTLPDDILKEFVDLRSDVEVYGVWTTFYNWITTVYERGYKDGHKDIQEQNEQSFKSSL